MKALRAKMRALRARILFHAKLGQPARKLHKAYHRAKAALAVAIRRERSAPRRKQIAWLRSVIGVHESGYTNTGPLIDAWERDFGLHGQPWCGVLCGEGLIHAGVPVDKGIVYVPNVAAWAKSGSHGFRQTYTPRMGDLACFEFDGHTPTGDHIATVLHAGPVFVTTLDGNSALPGGSQADGGEVVIRTRLRSTVVCFVDPHVHK